MLNIVIPMAGAGSRFANSRFTDPKPLIPIRGKPMIELVIANLRPAADHRFIFICQKNHLEQYALAELFYRWTANPLIIPIEGLTEGAACTVLKAQESINNDDPLMIANSDQYIDFSIDDYLFRQEHYDWDGNIMTMWANDPKWSFVRLNEHQLVIDVVEKKVISNEATVGIYSFKRGADFVRSAMQMISQNLRVNGEFYVAPIYNQLIAEGKKIGITNIGAVSNGMYGLGTPADLDYFLKHPISQAIGQVT